MALVVGLCRSASCTLVALLLLLGVPYCSLVSWDPHNHVANRKKVTHPGNTTSPLEETMSQNFCVVTRTRDDFSVINNFIDHYFNEGAAEIWVLDDLNGKQRFTAAHPNVHVVEVDLFTHQGVQEMVPVENLIKSIEGTRCTWILSVDSDEFVTSRRERCKSVQEILVSRFQEVDAISIPWVIYSATKIDTIDVRNDVIMRWNHSKHHAQESKLRKFRDRYYEIENKPMFRTKKFIKFKSPHAVVLQPGAVYADAATGHITSYSETLKRRFHEAEIHDAILAINHYRFPSIKHLVSKCTTRNRKSLNGNGYSLNRTTCLRESHSFNSAEVEDDILRRKIYISSLGADCERFWTLHDAARPERLCAESDQCCWIHLPLGNIYTTTYKRAVTASKYNLSGEMVLDKMEQIVLGQGTTGTHYFFNKQCNQGLRAVHWIRDCNFPSKNFPLLEEYKKRLQEFAAFPGNTVNEVVSKELRLLSLVQELQVQAYSDTGLSSFAEMVVKMSNRAKIIVSYRRPDVWARRTILLHGNTLICTPPWVSGEDAFQYSTCVSNSKYKGSRMFTKLKDLYNNKTLESEGVTAGLSGKEAVIASFVMHNVFISNLDPSRTGTVCIF